MTITNSGNFQLNLDADTDAFKAAPADELASILRHIADQIEDGMTSGYHVTDSNDEGNTAWSIDLPEAVEAETLDDQVKELDEKYVEFIVSSYEAGGTLAENIVKVYADNYDEELTVENADVIYIRALAEDDTEMGPARYLFRDTFREQVAADDELFAVSTI